MTPDQETFIRTFQSDLDALRTRLENFNDELRSDLVYTGDDEEDQDEDALNEQQALLDSLSEVQDDLSNLDTALADILPTPDSE